MKKKNNKVKIILLAALSHTFFHGKSPILLPVHPSSRIFQNF